MEKEQTLIQHELKAPWRWPLQANELGFRLENPVDSSILYLPMSVPLIGVQILSSLGGYTICAMIIYVFLGNLTAPHVKEMGYLVFCLLNLCIFGVGALFVYAGDYIGKIERQSDQIILYRYFGTFLKQPIRLHRKDLQASFFDYKKQRSYERYRYQNTPYAKLLLFTGPKRKKRSWLIPCPPSEANWISDQLNSWLKADVEEISQTEG